MTWRPHADTIFTAPQSNLWCITCSAQDHRSPQIHRRFNNILKTNWSDFLPYNVISVPAWDTVRRWRWLSLKIFCAKTHSLHLCRTPPQQGIIPSKAHQTSYSVINTAVQRRLTSLLWSAVDFCRDVLLWLSISRDGFVAFCCCRTVPCLPAPSLSCAQDHRDSSGMS